MRKYYIDNLRVFCILLLFPFHTFMIYNSWWQSFYLHGEALSTPTWFTILVYPWWMTLLFTLAGISSAYALKNRSCKEYAKERVMKLLVPLLTGLAIIVPVQSYIADIFYNGYTGSYFEHYKRFFTLTDFTGYDGAFTPGQLWFILFLFIISMVMLPIMNLYNKSKWKIHGEKITVPILLLLFIVILICTPILDIGGKSIGESLACFGIGFFILSIDEIQEKLEKNYILITALFIITLIIMIGVVKETGGSGFIWDMVYRIYLWFGILALLSMSKKFFNFSNNITKYLSKAAFPLYYFHQSILIVIGFFALKFINNVVLQIVIIMIGTFVLSLLAYEIFRRFKISSLLFGIKYKDK